jgi:exosortase/archaeosortase family protein
MIIYSLVMIVVAAKLQAPLPRKLVYMAVGVCGTIFLNVLRIFTIAYYGYAYATSGQQLDAFHNSIGEILFPIWIAIYLVIVLQLENMLIKREKPKKTTAPVTRQAIKEKPIRRTESKSRIRPPRKIEKPSKSTMRKARSWKKQGRSLKS